MSSTLIKNALVYDGVLVAPRRVDVFFEGGTIRGVEPGLRVRARSVIDASGKILIPGLIDVASDIDRYGGLFSHDIQKEFVRRGITTAIGGGSGVSLAPFRRALFQTFFYSPNFFHGNADWLSFGSFVKVLRAQKLLLHTGMLAGYRNFESPLYSKRDIREHIERALEEGALGISVPWDNSRGEQTFHDLAPVLAASGKVSLISFDPSRSAMGILPAIRRLVSRVRGKLHLSRLRPHVSLLPEYDFGHLDISLSPFTPYPLHGFLPPSFHGLEFFEMLQRVFCPEYEETILSHLRELPLEGAYISYVPHDLTAYSGARIQALAFRFQLELSRAILHLMRMSRLRVILSIRNAHPRHCLPFLSHPDSLISSGGGISLSSSLSSTHSFDSSLLSSAADSSGLSFGELLPKITSSPARLYGIERRGSIARGSRADLVLLNRGKVSKVFVDGELVFADGMFYDKYPGKVLV